MKQSLCISKLFFLFLKILCNRKKKQTQEILCVTCLLHVEWVGSAGGPTPQAQCHHLLLYQPPWCKPHPCSWIAHTGTCAHACTHATHRAHMTLHLAPAQTRSCALPRKEWHEGWEMDTSVLLCSGKPKLPSRWAHLRGWAQTKGLQELRSLVQLCGLKAGDWCTTLWSH